MNEMISPDWTDIGPKLGDPFTPNEIDWKPGATTQDKTRAMALAYLNARAVMDRLDAVVGPGNWNDSYRVLPDGEHVECTLTIFGVSKSDVGEPPGSDFADKMKSAYSDALKRAAVKFGIGRYLYRLEGQWVSYDQERKQLSEVPRLPAWALPEGMETIVSNKAPKDSPLSDNGNEPDLSATCDEERVDKWRERMAKNNKPTVGFLGSILANACPGRFSHEKHAVNWIHKHTGFKNNEQLDTDAALEIFDTATDDALAAVEGERNDGH